MLDLNERFSYTIGFSHALPSISSMNTLLRRSLEISTLAQKRALIKLLPIHGTFSIDTRVPAALAIHVMTSIFQNSEGTIGRLIQSGIMPSFFVSRWNPLCHHLRTRPFLPKTNGPNSNTLATSSSVVKLNIIKSLDVAIASTWPLVFHLRRKSIFCFSPTNLPINESFLFYVSKSALLQDRDSETHKHTHMLFKTSCVLSLIR